MVLVEPAGPLNIGSVARLCANFGIEDLRLVAPRCDPGDLDAKRMAVHGGQILGSARHFPTLFDALTDCQRVVASCGRIDHGEIPLQAPEQVMPWVQQGLESAAQVALVFGREDRGLSNEELLLSQRVVRLHSTEAYPSLNLSHAVAVMLHELERVRRQPSGQLNSAPQEDETAEPTQLIDLSLIHI